MNNGAASGIGMYRRRPTTVEAVRLTWQNWNAVCQLLSGVVSPNNPAREINASEVSDTAGEVGPTYIAVDVPTIHGDMATARHGDWILRDAKPGTFYPCHPDVFAATYEPVSSNA